MNILQIQKRILNMTVEEAITELGILELTLRQVRSNGRPCIVTRDFVPTRVNVSVVDGRVVEVLSMG